mgnify:CR=1 FL=1
MIATSPKLSIMVLAAIPVIVFPLVGFGRSVRQRSRAAQDTLAEASSYAGEVISAARTKPLRSTMSIPSCTAHLARRTSGRLSLRWFCC